MWPCMGQGIEVVLQDLVATHIPAPRAQPYMGVIGFSAAQPAPRDQPYMGVGGFSAVLRLHLVTNPTWM